MREILFRGEMKENGDWAFGDLSFHRDGRTYIRYWDRLEHSPTYNAYEVDHATVGQFTGLYDCTKWEDLNDAEKTAFYKRHYIGEDGMSVRFQHIDDVKHLWKGKKIFEGDILQFTAYGTEYTGKVEFLNGAFWIKCRYHDNLGTIVYRYKPRITGNIHDNPELLEVSE